MGVTVYSGSDTVVLLHEEPPGSGSPIDPVGQTIDSFAASPNPITAGQSSTLSWSTSNASKVTLDGADVALNGSSVKAPAVDTAYTLVAFGSVPNVTRTVSLVVQAVVPPTGKIPALGQNMHSSGNNRGPADWIDPSQLPAPIPWSGYVDVPNRIIAPSQNGVRPIYFVRENLCGNCNRLYGTMPIIRNGKHEQFWPQAGSDMLVDILPTLAARPTPTGVRGVGLVEPFTTWHGHPSIPSNSRAPLWLGIRADGAMTMLMDNGDLELLGWITGTHGTYDYSFFVPNRAIFFVADWGNGRILKIDRTAAIAARPPGALEDWHLWAQTVFASGLNNPTSIRCTDDGTMYVVESGNNRLLKMAANGTIASVVTSITNLFWVDYTSDGTLVLATLDTYIYKFLATTGLSAQLMPHTPNGQSAGVACTFITVEVNREGTLGPADEFFVARDGGAAGKDSWQFRNDGTVLQAGTIKPTGQAGWFEQQELASVGNNFRCGEGAHYDWYGVPHPTQALFLRGGKAQSTPCVIRAGRAGDPVYETTDNDHADLRKGEAIVRCGTVASYQSANGNFTRPSFTSLVNEDGWSCLGLSCDYATELVYASGSADFSKLAQFIQGGWGGSVPRPEIVGKDLQAFGIWALHASQRYARQGKALTDAWRAWIATNFPGAPATVDPFAPQATSSDVHMRAVKSGANLQVQFIDYGENIKQPVSGLQVTIVVDEGTANEIKSGALTAPFTWPLPALAPGPHATTVRATQAGYFSLGVVI